MRFVLNVLARRMIPWTSYPLESRSSARYEPSCPVIPVTSARFISDLGLLFSCRSENCSFDVFLRTVRSLLKPGQDIQIRALVAPQPDIRIRRNRHGKARHVFHASQKL